MTRYVRRPGEPVEARQVTADNMEEIAEWCGGLVGWTDRMVQVDRYTKRSQRVPAARTKGLVFASATEWLLFDFSNPYAHGAWWVESDEDFQATYQPEGSSERLLDEWKKTALDWKDSAAVAWGHAKDSDRAAESLQSTLDSLIVELRETRDTYTDTAMEWNRNPTQQIDPGQLGAFRLAMYLLEKFDLDEQEQV